MENSINLHLEKALEKYTENHYREVLINAKNDFFKITGNINEEDDDYDLRMNSFNDWYLTQFCLPNEKRSPLMDYIFSVDLEESLGSVLANYQHSIFQYVGEKRGGEFVFKDLREKKRVKVKNKNVVPMLVKGDIFLGRFFELENEIYFMSGVCIIPREVKMVVLNEIKKVSSNCSRRDLNNFLLKLEYLKTKSKRYSHLALEKIFSF